MITPLLVVVTPPSCEYENKSLQVCDHTLLYATASDDLSFALRMCQYMDEEGLWCDSDVRDNLCRSVAMAIRRLPETAVVSTDGGGEEGSWIVEGTNATVKELWALNTLLHRWLDTEMEEVDDSDLDEEEVFRLEGEGENERRTDEVGCPWEAGYIYILRMYLFF